MAGVVVLVVDVVRGFERLDEYRRRPQVIEAATLEVRAEFPRGAVSGGARPTVEERLDQLERELGQVRDELGERMAGVEAEAREASSEAAGRAVQHSERRFSALSAPCWGTRRGTNGGDSRASPRSFWK